MSVPARSETPVMLDTHFAILLFYTLKTLLQEWLEMVVTKPGRGLLGIWSCQWRKVIVKRDESMVSKW